MLPRSLLPSLKVLVVSQHVHGRGRWVQAAGARPAPVRLPVYLHTLPPRLYEQAPLLLTHQCEGVGLRQALARLWRDPQALAGAARRESVAGGPQSPANLAFSHAAPSLCPCGLSALSPGHSGNLKTRNHTTQTATSKPTQNAQRLPPPSTKARITMPRHAIASTGKPTSATRVQPSELTPPPLPLAST